MTPPARGCTWRPRLTRAVPYGDANVAFQVSGVWASLADQNLTLLVPSAAAVAKMSSEDTNFWTSKGNLPSLIRLQVDRCFRLPLRSRLHATVCPQESHDPRSPSLVQPRQPDLPDLPPQDSTSCVLQRGGESTAARRAWRRYPAALTFFVLLAGDCCWSNHHHGRHCCNQRADPPDRPGEGGAVWAWTRRCSAGSQGPVLCPGSGS